MKGTTKKQADHHSKKKKRVRGPKFKIHRVLRAGELPNDKRLKSGKVRHLDILAKHPQDAIPRKAQTLFASISKGPEKWSKANHSKKNNASTGPTTTDEPRKSESTGSKQHNNKMFDGMQPGETFTQFSSRLRTQTRAMVLNTARKASHQHIKKKAHYEKRRQRLERRKKRRRGQVDDDEDEIAPGDEELGQDDDALDDERMRLNQLPMYWQEIVRNNGRPLSEKKRRRLNLLEQQNDHVAFGTQAERPPELTARPKLRTKNTSL